MRKHYLQLGSYCRLHWLLDWRTLPNNRLTCIDSTPSVSDDQINKKDPYWTWVGSKWLEIALGQPYQRTNIQRKVSYNPMSCSFFHDGPIHRNLLFMILFRTPINRKRSSIGCPSACFYHTICPGNVVIKFFHAWIPWALLQTTLSLISLSSTWNCGLKLCLVF